MKSNLAKQPKVGLNRDTPEILLDEIEITGERKIGLETLKDRFVKHVSARSKQIASRYVSFCQLDIICLIFFRAIFHPFTFPNYRKTAPEVVSIAKKEIGPDGVVRICHEQIVLGVEGATVDDQKINFDLVKQAQKSEKPGAQQVC